LDIDQVLEENFDCLSFTPPLIAFSGPLQTLLIRADPHIPVARLVNPVKKILVKHSGSSELMKPHVLARLGWEVARVKALHALVQLIEAAQG
jgi:hypothetical protein